MLNTQLDCLMYETKSMTSGVSSPFWWRNILLRILCLLGGSCQLWPRFTHYKQSQYLKSSTQMQGSPQRPPKDRLSEIHVSKTWICLHIFRVKLHKQQTVTRLVQSGISLAFAIFIHALIDFLAFGLLTSRERFQGLKPARRNSRSAGFRKQVVIVS